MHAFRRIIERGSFARTAEDLGLSPALFALPARLLLLTLTRRLPPRAWIGQSLLPGGFNFALFWVLLSVAADSVWAGQRAKRPGASASVGLARPRQGTTL